MKPQLAVIRGCIESTEDNGRIVEIIERVATGSVWTDPNGEKYFSSRPNFAVLSLGRPFSHVNLAGRPSGSSMYAIFAEDRVFPINDNLGNEQFVTDARKSLPSNGTRITERGEIA